jgi:CPA1 family monovalent cation:H+ antiporter
MEMGLVKGLVFVCLFLIGLCAVEHHFRFSRLPYICWVVLFGALYGILNTSVWPGLPRFHLSADVILFIFLPVLIFESSRQLDLAMARTEAIPAFVLATAGVLISMGVMAVPLRFLTGGSWSDVLFFSAIMSATDPVAVAAVFKQFSIPEKLKTLLEGESLLNDGTTVIIFMLLSGKVLDGKSILAEHGVLVFAISVIGAVLLGALTGWGGALLIRKWKALKDNFIGPLLPLLIVYLTFCLAQASLELSGVIAVMSTTITMRLCYARFRPDEIPSEIQIEFYRGFWEFLGELANAVLFFMLGVEIGVHYYEISWLAMPGVIAALLLSRSVVVYGFGALFREGGIRLPRPWLHVLNMGGLKGALSVALVLMIPEEYPYRNRFLCAALAMSLFTLIANTLALRVYLRKTKFNETA